MLILNQERLASYLRQHPEAKGALLRWELITAQAEWHSVIDVRQSFPTVDQVCQCLVFNIRGGNYRLITGVNYARQVITLLYFLTHKEYDRDRWKKDCGC